MPNDSKTTKTFALADVLGTITGRLLGKIDGVYQVSEFMSGEPVWTHQLPRVGMEIRPVVLLQHPQLAPVINEAEAVTPDNWQEMLAGWIGRFGDTIALSPMTAELAEKVHPDRIITVKL
jgi:hypothetical protein